MSEKRSKWLASAPTLHKHAADGVALTRAAASDSDTEVQDCTPTVSDVAVAVAGDVGDGVGLAHEATAEARLPRPLVPGTHVGPFAVEGLLTAGGMAEIYLARDERDRRVALKVINPRYARTKPVAMARLRCEAKALRHLDHEHIIDFRGAGSSSDGRPYLAMRYVHGRTLQQRLEDQGPLSPAEVARVAHGIASALTAVHDRDIIHRDIKPGNVLLDRHDDHVWLIDFGLARGLARGGTCCPGCGLDTDRCRSHGQVAHTDRFSIAGTPAYMSPEQWNGAPADCPADIWALGVVMLEMLDGHPWAGLSPAELRGRVLSEKPLAVLSRTRRWLPAELATCVTCCLTYNPERRPTATELQEALASYLALGDHDDLLGPTLDLRDELPGSDSVTGVYSDSGVDPFG